MIRLDKPLSISATEAFTFRLLLDGVSGNKRTVVNTYIIICNKSYTYHCTYRTYNNFFFFARKGAPFANPFQDVIGHLEDAGLISYWTNEVIARRIKENRAASVESRNLQNPLHVSATFFNLYSNIARK